MFNKGWEAEDNDSPDAATKYFKGSQIQAKQACIMFPNNMHYKQILNISTLKIEGNMVFNQGMSLQREANTLQNAGLYQQAIDKYTTAEQKFRGGLEFDQRFDCCVNFVAGCIKECQVYINHNRNLINRISVENVNPENSNDQNISSTNRVRQQRLQYQ